MRFFKVQDSALVIMQKERFFLLFLSYHPYYQVEENIVVIQTVTVFQLIVVKKQCVNQDQKRLKNYQSSKDSSHTPAYLILSLAEFATITGRYLLSLFFFF